MLTYPPSEYNSFQALLFPQGTDTTTTSSRSGSDAILKRRKHPFHAIIIMPFSVTSCELHVPCRTHLNKRSQTTD
jgi:hypothetical protein